MKENEEKPKVRKVTAKRKLPEFEFDLPVNMFAIASPFLAKKTKSGIELNESTAKEVAEQLASRQGSKAFTVVGVAENIAHFIAPGDEAYLKPGTEGHDMKVDGIHFSIINYFDLAIRRKKPTGKDVYESIDEHIEAEKKGISPNQMKIEN